MIEVRADRNGMELPTFYLAEVVNGVRVFRDLADALNTVEQILGAHDPGTISLKAVGADPK
jgi:hypothetical protein